MYAARYKCNQILEIIKFIFKKLFNEYFEDYDIIFVYKLPS